jgi:predicted DNA-binding transcriptional regulator AlpA
MSTASASPGALLSLRQLGAYLNRSVASLHRDLAAGRLPRGVRIGRSRRWSPQEIDAWLAAGCPPAAEWEARRRAK